jgi:hypothetical protein
VALAALAATVPARAEVRLLIAVGAEVGLKTDVRLRYAQQDARRVAAALSELGAVTQSQVLEGPDAAGIQTALGVASKATAAAHQRGERVILFFFFSGHADADFLHAARSRLSWDSLRSQLRAVGADATVSFVDACASGGASSKGATPGKPFQVERESRPTRGVVWFTSSRGDEASYESDELGGSFFTHYLVSALRGAADLDENGRVTLNEVYRFAYEQTVGETSLRLKAVQHPTYDVELAGEGDLTLTEIPLARSSLVLPRELEGVYFVSRRFGSSRSTIEVAKRPGILSRVGVAEGTYLVYRRDEDRIWLANYQLARGGEVVVEPGDLRSRRYEDVVRKGGGIALDTWRLWATGGSLGPPVKGAGLLAPGARLGLVRRDAWTGVGIDLGYSQFRFDAKDTRVRNQALEVVLRWEAFRETRLGVLSVGAGAGALALAQSPGLGSRRSSLSPGLVLGGALEHRLFGRLSLRADAGVATWLVRMEGSSGVTPRLSPRFGLGLAMELR